MSPLFSAQLVGILAILLGILFIIYIRRHKKSEIQLDEIAEAYLIDMGNATPRKEYRIQKKITIIGRMKSRNVDVCIAGNTISIEHAQIEYKNGRFYLTDLRSGNGTFLNKEDEKVTSEVNLRDGDIIMFDKYKFRFLMPEHSRKYAGRLDKSPYGHTILRAP